MLAELFSCIAMSEIMSFGQAKEVGVLRIDKKKFGENESGDFVPGNAVKYVA